MTLEFPTVFRLDMEIRFWTVSLSLVAKESGYWMFEGLILVNQLESKVYPRVPVCKSISALFCIKGFYCRCSMFSKMLCKLTAWREYRRWCVDINQLFNLIEHIKRKDKKNYIWHRRITMHYQMTVNQNFHE